MVCGVVARLAALLALRPATRPWPFAVLAALGVGLSLAGGAALGDVPAGGNAALAAFAFCALPPGAAARQYVVVAAMGLGIVAGFAIGTLAAPAGVLAGVALGLFAAAAIGAVLHWRLGMPGALFPVMSAALATQIAQPVAALPATALHLGCGVGMALLLVPVYRALLPHAAQGPAPAPPTPLAWAERTGAVSLVVGLAVAAAFALAHTAGVARPYWAPVSCIAVIQGMSFAAIRTRHRHRVAGTLLGLVPAAALLPLAGNGWTLALAVGILAWGVETLVARQYALAVVLITPLALLLAQAAHHGPLDLATLLWARGIDTVIGSAMGLLGAAVLARLPVGGADQGSSSEESP